MKPWQPIHLNAVPTPVYRLFDREDKLKDIIKPF